MYAIVYLGFALADNAWHVFALYAVYGIYYGVAYGTTKALVADMVPENLRGTAYGTYNAVLSHHRFARVGDRRRVVARRRRVEWLWRVGSILFRRGDGAASAR